MFTLSDKTMEGMLCRKRGYKQLKTLIKKIIDPHSDI